MRRIFLTYTRLRDLIAAIWFDGWRSLRCGHCGGLNTFADDLGFWFIAPQGDDVKVCCRKCYDGEPGRKHIERYGLGER